LLGPVKLILQQPLRVHFGDLVTLFVKVSPKARQAALTAPKEASEDPT
jgi:hypothetical protein